MWIVVVCTICVLSNCMHTLLAIHQTLERSEPKEINVRLIAAESNFKYIGRLEIQDASNSSNPYGTVCDDLWDNKAASVVCRQLGYKWGEAVKGFVSKNMNDVPIFLDDVQCEGHETSLLDCLHSGWGNHDCSHSEDAGALCHNETVRLESPADDASVGNVQVMYKYRWAEVCDTNWGDFSARLACQDLGYVDGLAQCCSAFGTPSFTELDYSVTFNCTANDTALDTCKRGTFFEQCDVYHRASAICYNATLDKVDKNFSIRISGREAHWGRLEIRRLGVWGQMCVNIWDDAAANVTCRQLGQGFIGGHALGQSKTSRLPIWLSAVSCQGNETSIDECAKSMWGEPAAGDCNTAYVLCYMKSGVSLEIVNSSFPGQGRLQLTFDGVPGSVGTKEWSNNDAHIACRQMGYASGVTSEPTAVVTPYYLNKLICYSEDIKSILQCANTGWGVNSTGLTSSATVRCYTHVRLHNGGTSSGIVEIHDGRRWIGLCDLGFTKDLAQLVCHETSHTDNGDFLQVGAYGAYYRHLGRPYLNCSANETSVGDCAYDEQVTCSGFIYNYVSVSCYNGSNQEDKVYELLGGPGVGHGLMTVSYKHQVGEICSTGWGDKEADVFCRSLDQQFIGGVSVYYHGTPDVPMLLAEVTCLGNESKMAECKTDETVPCYTKLRAGSICYKKSAPTVKLVDGGRNFGRVEIDVDGQSGLVIDKSWSNKEAQVVCKDISKDYVGGEIYSNFTKPSSGDVYLNDVNCVGYGGSILHCEHSGWRTAQETDYNHTVGVYCFENVRVYGGIISSDFMIGRLQVISVHVDTNSISETWVNICADEFDQVDADVVCRQMTYDIAEILVPGFAFLNTEAVYYTNMTCKEGGMNVLQDCLFSQRACRHASHNFANVLCKKKDVKPNVKFYIQHGYHGLVYAERYGVKGTICADGWDNADAAVICRENGYKGGVVLGGPEMYFRSDPVWFTNVSCTNESAFADCPMSGDVSVSCAMSLTAARVLCYNGSGIHISLENEKNASSYGRIRVQHDGSSGYVCRNLGAGLYDTVCRQLGYPTGEYHRYSDYGDAVGAPIWLSDISCFHGGPYDSILACSNRGWGQRNPRCYSFAEVKCQRNVMTKEADNYGAVRVWNENRYSLVCADKFDDNDATIVCRQMGYPFGKSICCSAFGIVEERIEVSDMQCTGSETDITQCVMIRGVNGCASQQYASVVCSKDQMLVGFSVDIRSTDNNRNTSDVGPVIVDYFNQIGEICVENFDDRDAVVICRQLGFVDGFSYRFFKKRVSERVSASLRWLKGPDCTGDEQQLELCPGIQLGNVSGCQPKASAAVFCHKEEDKSGFELRLSNSNHPGEGYVEVKVNGSWGSICRADTFINQYVATVICRQLNFKDGYETVFPTFPRLNGTVWLNGVYCNGDEHSLKDCMLSGFEAMPNVKCATHRYDLAVKCYSDVRLSGVSTPNYGMVQLTLSSIGWTSVCDVGFDDVDAKIVCKSLGYKDGKAQCCSALGSKLIRYSPIGVSDVRCNGTEPTFSACTMETANVTCESGTYASVLCTAESPPQEGLQVKVKDGRYYGDVEVVRYGLFGSMCDAGWNDTDATVLCRSMGYVSGYATNGTDTGADPMILTDVDCTGNETNIGQCKYLPLIDGHVCNNRSTRAATLCSMDKEKIRYRVADMRNERGRAEIYFNGRWGTICDTYWEDKDADIFCKQAGYLFGEATTLMPAGSDDMPIWMTRVECNGNETDFLQCRASWDRNMTSRCSHFEDAGVRCYSTARLFRGDYMTKRTNGIVEIYVQQSDPLRSPWYTLCADTFTNNEAEVVCRSFGHEHGISLCCGPYGYSTTPMARFRPRCNGTERQISDCDQVRNVTKCSRQNYASVVCYNGTRPVDVYRLALKGSLHYTGQVAVNYLGVPGSICWDGWTDADARVVCRELGFKNGSSYYHYKSSFIYLDYNGPYWTSDVSCVGNESKLSDCPHAGFGNVKECQDRGHYAGVICFDGADMAFRISGGNDRYGRVEFYYGNQWHSFCSQNWGHQEADVMCRQLGYVTGTSYDGAYSDVAMGDPYTIDFRCSGIEENIKSCPHEGLTEADYCKDHKEDEGVFCYTSVKLSGKPDTNNGNGTVLYYHNNEWLLVCDDDFDDVTAEMVCRELGYVTGYAICCSAYGKAFEDLMTNQTLQCTGEETSIGQCLQNRTCNSTHYASAVCFSSYDAVKDNSYSFEIAKSEKGQVQVTHYGVKGRICSRDWDDREARVFCGTQGFDHGLAYQHSESNVLQEVRGPYWLSGFNCTGDEKSLLDCAYMDRTALGNCKENDIASVLCYNESGIEYRMVDGGDHYGRVEISVGGRWGTICDSFWDEREASIFCQQMNFTDGEPVGRAHFGEGKGPIWLSHLECKGTEKKLHECPHRGFANEFSFDWWFPLPCETHADDAGVFCYKSARLSNGPNSNSGGLEMYNNGTWYAVCDSNFGIIEAKVACRSLKTEYIDGRAIPGSAYGENSRPILFSNLNCTGDEKDIINCRMEINSTCQSGHYVSVECSDKPIIDDGFEMRLSTDSLAGRYHGILEVKVGGIWGRICLHNFDDTDASVACRQLGYDGGVAYLHIMKNDRPVLMREVTCVGNETSLDNCTSEKFSPDIEHCNYGSNDAGVVCYNVTKGIGFDYRLVDGANPSVGRVEIGYAGRWGAVCSWSWQTADAKVLCRSMGYADGIVKYVNEGPPLPLIRPWVSGFFCQGSEPSPLTCLNTGFNSSFLADLCIGRKELGAYSQCFNTSAEATQIRLVGGPNNYTGRVEVFVSGANEWGTICDDHWDDVDAHVTCRQLGYFGGSARRKAAFGMGTGPIWFDNMKCNGSEETLFECEHRGIGTHNCNHQEDVGVICQETPVLSNNTALNKSTEVNVTTEKSPIKKEMVTEPAIKLTPTRTTKAKPVKSSPSTLATTEATGERVSTTVATITKTTTSEDLISSTVVSKTSSASEKVHVSVTTDSIVTMTIVERTPSHQQATKQHASPSSSSSSPSSSSSAASSSSTTEQTKQTLTTKEPISLKQTTQKQTTIDHVTQTKTTHEQTTQSITIFSSSSTRRNDSTIMSQTTTLVSFSTNNISEVAQRNNISRANIAAWVIIPLCLILVTIVIIAIVIIARKRKRSGYGRELFDDSIISQDQEGNISATNQLYDLDQRPSDSNGFTEAGNSEKINVNKNGRPSDLKGLRQRNELESSAFSNPLYEASKYLNSPGAENNDFKLSLQEDIKFQNTKDDFS